MKEITEEWCHLSHLTHLCFTQCYMERNTNDYRWFVDSIWRLPKLIHCDFGINFPPDVYFPAPSVTSLSLEHLSVPCVNFRFKEFSQLIKHTPGIRHLCICLNRYSVDQDLSFTIPSMISLDLHVRDASFAITKFLKCMPKLNHLTVKSSDTYLGNLKNCLDYLFDDNATKWHQFYRHSTPVYMNGSEWEEIIVNHLPELKSFQLKMEIQYWSRNNKQDEVDKLLTSFGSDFWIREHQWFVRCDWNPEKQSCCLCLYTLPYAFERFDTRTASIQSKSTSPNENDYWFYDRVRNLHYHVSLANSSALSRVRFSHIRHLSIELPSNDNVWFTLSRFDHLNSLDVYILNDDVKAQNQLQILLDRAPNLYSLRFSCGKLSASEMALLKNSSVLVRRLDLHGYTEHQDWHWFNSQQCAALCNSPLGIQCEMLRIRVENPMDVLELVYSMPYLRALNVQILNDEHNVPNFKSSPTENELIQFLQHSLDSTCTVARNESDSRYIQLWIR